MASTTPAHTIRPAANLEEARALWWPLISKLGWNRSEDDAKTHFLVSKSGKNWLHIIPEESGNPEGSVIAFEYLNSTGWVAFFIMNAAYRERGLGRELWKEMEVTFRAGGTKIIGLDGVPEQVETYKRRGFQCHARIPLMLRKSLQEWPLASLDKNDTVVIKSLTKDDASELAKLDLEHTGLDRSAFWAPGALLSQRKSFGFTIVSNSRMTGFVFVRPCEDGYRVGPLIAETYEQARQLLHNAISHCEKQDANFVAEIFGTNKDGRRVFEDLGWTYAAISYHRMWLNGFVPPEQQESGKGAKGMYAILDACAG